MAIAKGVSNVEERTFWGLDERSHQRGPSLKIFRKFSVISASKDAFLRLWAAWSTLKEAKKTTDNSLVASGLTQGRMVGVTELESVTSTMSTWRSNQLSYTPALLYP